jgi:hypothetical protein
VVDPDVDPAGIGGQVVDAVRDGLLDLGPGEKEAVILHLHRLPARAPLATSIGQPSQLLTLFGVHTDHRLVGGLVLLDLLVEIAKLRIPVRVLLAFQSLDVGLQAEALLHQQLAHRRRRDAMALPGQLLGQVPQRLSRPPQRRHRVPAFVRFY